MIRDWVELNMTPGIGPRAAAKLLERFGSAEAVYKATRAELEQLRLPPEAVDTIIARDLLPRAEAEITRSQSPRRRHPFVGRRGLSLTFTGNLRPAYCSVC